MDDRWSTPVDTPLAASTAHSLYTLLVADFDVALLFDALLVYWKESPTARPGLRSPLQNTSNNRRK